MKLLLPAVYFGNIEYFSYLLSDAEILIENHEHFVKQTYRNRCEIYGANGKLDLIVPIKKGRSERTLVHQAQIDNSTRWQVLHWRSIESGYRRSPYFEYYEDKLHPLFSQPFELLSELNAQSTRFILDQLRTEKTLSLTGEYEKEYEGITDLRGHFHPKNATAFHHPVYTQVFETKYGFLPNLTVLDVLFNLGPQGISILRKK